MTFKLNSEKTQVKISKTTQIIYILIIMTRMNEHKSLLTFFGGMEQGLCFPSLVK